MYASTGAKNFTESLRRMLDVRFFFKKTVRRSFELSRPEMVVRDERVQGKIKYKIQMRLSRSILN